MTNDVIFPCHSCGACRMVLGKILENEDNVNEEYIDLVREFPYKADQGGWCEKLGSDLKCTIYETRPLLCRIKEVWKLKFSKTRTMEKYFSDTTTACKCLMKEMLGMTEDQINKAYEDIIP